MTPRVDSNFTFVMLLRERMHSRSTHPNVFWKNELVTWIKKKDCVAGLFLKMLQICSVQLFYRTGLGKCFQHGITDLANV